MAWTNIYLNDSMAMMQATKKKKTNEDIQNVFISVFFFWEQTNR